MAFSTQFQRRIQCPNGEHKILTIFSPENLLNLNALVADVTFVHGDYSQIISPGAKSNRSFFYFDPPYRRLKTDLTMYNEDPFGDDEQLQLRDHIHDLISKGHSFLLPINSDLECRPK